MKCRLRSGRDQAGFSLLEVLIACVVAFIAICALVAAISNAMMVTEQNREYARAMEAARNKLEEMQSYEFTQVFAAYNQATGDDPPSAPGSDFTVEGLNVWAADPDGFQGKVILPESPTQSGWVDEIRTAQICGTSSAMDLNGDGDSTDTFNPAVNRYGMMPVLIRIEWNGVNDNSVYELRAVILRR